MYRGSLFLCGARGTIAISLVEFEKGELSSDEEPEFQTFYGGQASDRVERVGGFKAGCARARFGTKLGPFSTK